MTRNDNHIPHTKGENIYCMDLCTVQLDTSFCSMACLYDVKGKLRALTSQKSDPVQKMYITLTLVKTIVSIF